MRQNCLDFNLNHKKLGRELTGREILENPLQNDIWAYVGMLPH